MTTTPVSPPVWDLSDLYDAIDDPRIEADVAAAQARAQAFEARYAGQIASPALSAETLRAALDEMSWRLHARVGRDRVTRAVVASGLDRGRWQMAVEQASVRDGANVCPMAR